MHPTKRRWSKTYEAAEEELLRFLDAKRIVAKRIELSEFEQPPEVTNETSLILWCAEGSFECNADNTLFRMQAGDSLEIPADVTVNMSAGFSGCVYYQKSA